MRQPLATCGDLGIKRRFKNKILWVAGRRRSPGMWSPVTCGQSWPNRGLVGLIGDWLLVTWGRPCLNRGLIGLIAVGSQIQPAATGADLRSPKADNKIWLLVVEVVGWYQTCLIFSMTTTATYGISINCLKIALRSPGSMPKYGGLSLVVACGNLVLSGPIACLPYGSDNQGSTVYYEWLRNTLIFQPLFYMIRF